MKGTLSELHRRGTDVQRKGWTNNFLHFLIDSLWRDEIWVKKLIFLFVPLAQKQSDWNQNDNTKADYIKNKPTITDGDDGREVELSTSGGYVVWRYVGDVAWNNLFLIPADGTPGAPGNDGREIELRENAGWVEWRYIGDVSWTQLFEIQEGGGTDNGVKVAIDFVSEDALEFVYKCPQAMKFTSQESEGADATISPALNTNLSQYQAVTITASEVGLIVLIGETL